MAKADGEDGVLRLVVDAEVHVVRRRIDEQVLALDDAGLRSIGVRIGQRLGLVGVTNGETQTLSFHFVVGNDAIVHRSERVEVEEREVALVEEVVGHLRRAGVPVERWKGAVHERRIVVFGNLGKVDDRCLDGDPHEAEMIGHAVGRLAVSTRRYGKRRGLRRDLDTASIGSEPVSVVGTFERPFDDTARRQRREAMGAAVR